MKKNYLARAYEKPLRESARNAAARDYLYEDGFMRAALAAPELVLGRPLRNGRRQEEAYLHAVAEGADLVVFPILSLCGVTLGDLSLTESLLEQAETALLQLAAATLTSHAALITSLPLRVHGALYAALAYISGGRVHALMPVPVPETHPAFRYYSQGPLSEAELPLCDYCFADGTTAPLLPPAAFRLETFPHLPLVPLFECAPSSAVLGFSPSEGPAGPALRGALALVFSYLPETPGRSASLTAWAKSLAERGQSAVALLSPAQGESGSDASYGGYRLLCEGDTLLGQSTPFTRDTLIFDIDTRYLADKAAELAPLCGLPEEDGPLFPAKLPKLSPAALRREKLRRPMDPSPFVPAPENRAAFCEEVFAIVTEGLRRRLTHVRSQKLVLGLSGGLDSCLAMLSARRCLLALGRPAEDLLCVGMPGPGSSSRTKSNSARLAESAGCSYREIPIGPAVELHLKDIGHDGKTSDVSFENAQARERTQILMDLANMIGGLVLGTGDLSESALGWCTYNGDQMSMYSLNAAIPKTLVRALCQYEAERFIPDEPALAEVILDILATPVSPELVPPTDGRIAQKTEEIIGPYELHDFFLWQLLKRHARPQKILRLAIEAFSDQFTPEVIERCLRIFLKRFSVSQFKRTASPDGADLGLVSLSPRGGLVMPSDLSADLLLSDLDEPDTRS